jgi:hypothetical protein
LTAGDVLVGAIGFFAFYEVDVKPPGLVLWQLFGVGTFLLVLALWLVVEAGLAVARYRERQEKVEALDIDI